MAYILTRITHNCLYSILLWSEEGVAEVSLGVVNLGHVGAELVQGLGLVNVWKDHKFMDGNENQLRMFDAGL